MQMEKCSNCGKHSDKEKHKSCPYCSQEITGGAGFFDNRRGSRAGGARRQPEKTEVWGGDGNQNRPTPPNRPVPKTEEFGKFPNGNRGGGSNFVPPTEEYIYQQKETEQMNPPPRPKPNPMSQNIQDKITGGGGQKPNPDATISIDKVKRDKDKRDEVEPVVGWLVIVEGKGRGNDLRVVAGQNSIGRGRSNMICVDFGDETISRDRHAFIIYDTKHKKFIFRSGDGQNISYLNDAGVYSPEPIKDGDTIEIGETKLRFSTFCNENFEW
ncbi:FHA domain-containing protein [Sulfurovum sp. bin170]|uniref:FHA domain-containing protein n=1 Tax=Sulfurovum sp. bin170 TaxID=2695268 RepID=UPI0013E0B365|nr:FHA domain-containing protein [Sulfurovum sp. bin170]NEW60696.1 FHA domain-containing protein [Sulfurovum sp. bin170]